MAATRRTTTTTTTPPTTPPTGPSPMADFTTELVSAPALDVDQQIRAIALLAAAIAGAGVRARIEPILATARAFEAYLRGDQ